MANAHHLDALVARELLTDGGFGEESLTAHGTHGWQRELFRYLQDMDGIVATAFPQIGSEGQRTDKNNSGQHFRTPQQYLMDPLRGASCNDRQMKKLTGHLLPLDRWPARVPGLAPFAACVLLPPFRTRTAHIV